MKTEVKNVHLINVLVTITSQEVGNFDTRMRFDA